MSRRPGTIHQRGPRLPALLGLALVSSCALAAPDRVFIEPCQRTESFPMPATRGPFDYRNTPGTLAMVESNHFTPQVETLLRGKTGPFVTDLSFVLHAFPNHHRALAALVRYGEKEKSRQPGNLDYSIDCYFERALRFRSDDNIVRMLYVDYLGRTKRESDALTQLLVVKASAQDNPITQYNVGLLYFQLGRYAEAREQAHLAMAAGVQRTDLMEKLKAKGQWQEPSASVAPPAASAASGPGA